MKNAKPKGHEYSNSCACPYCEEIRERFKDMMEMFAEHGIAPLAVDAENDPAWTDKVVGRVREEATKIIDKRSQATI